MKIVISLLLMTLLLSCSNQEKLAVLKTNSKVISIKEGNELHEGMWTISTEVELDVFVTRKFNGTKKVSFISEIDTLHTLRHSFATHCIENNINIRHLQNMLYQFMFEFVVKENDNFFLYMNNKNQA